MCQMRASTGRKQEAVTVTRGYSTRVLAWTGALRRPAGDDLLSSRPQVRVLLGALPGRTSILS